MIVSWNWLKEYVRLDVSAEKLAERLMLAGFNLEGIGDVDGDITIDLEITSNRPDCLGHLGVAREIAALTGQELKLPESAPPEAGPDLSGVLK
ncbi:MAG TPA: phenylalanine--tRNA ligase subunit beta, partial [Planctomycetia bacterium]|nr:phenylalanine--tRNA ligase subunit beta [Planctomycetia bacterium]